MKQIDTQKLKNELDQFCGTEQYYHYYNLLLTDGVKFLCEEASCHWFMDVIYSHLKFPKWKGEEDFIVCTLKVKNDRGIVTFDNGGIWDDEAQNDSVKILAKQEIEYTDFPLEEIKLYIVKYA